MITRSVRRIAKGMPRLAYPDHLTENECKEVWGFVTNNRNPAKFMEAYPDLSEEAAVSKFLRKLPKDFDFGEYTPDQISEGMVRYLQDELYLPESEREILRDHIVYKRSKPPKRPL